MARNAIGAALNKQIKRTSVEIVQCQCGKLFDEDQVPDCRLYSGDDALCDECVEAIEQLLIEAAKAEEKTLVKN
jgi:hypothetical protein